jgi:predicted  nucleic acid-binding Zn ribbon protein
MQNNVILCPSCNSECYFRLDEWGHTPFHLHCDKCDINIGSVSFKKCINLLQ